MHLIMQSTGDCWRICGMHHSKRLAKESLVHLVLRGLEEQGGSVTRERTPPGSGKTEYDEVLVDMFVVRSQLVVAEYGGLLEELGLEITLPHYVYDVVLRWGEFSNEHGQWRADTDFFLVEL